MNQSLKKLRAYPSTSTRENLIKKRIEIAMTDFMKEQLPQFRKIRLKAAKIEMDSLNSLYLMYFFFLNLLIFLNKNWSIVY